MLRTITQVIASLSRRVVRTFAPPSDRRTAAPFRPGLDAFGGMAARAPRPPDLGFHPALEALEERRTPAMFYWKGGGSASDPASWWNNAVPQAGDDVIFWYVGYSADCPDFAGPPDGGYYHSVTLIGGPSGYPGTVTLAGPLFTESLDVESGTIDQPDDGDDITVGPQSAGTETSFIWSGGATINGTSHLANVNIQGDVTFTIDPQGGTLTTGSTLNFEGTDDAEATCTGSIKAGTIVFNNAAVYSLSGDGTTLTIDTTAGDVVFTQPASPPPPPASPPPPQPVATIGVGTKVTVEGGNNNPQPSPMIVAGELDVIGGASLNFTGGVPGVQVSVATQGPEGQALGSGLIVIENGSKLIAANWVRINTGGILQSQVKPGAGADQRSIPAKVQGDLYLAGGSLKIEPASFNPHVWGKFEVTGNAVWDGGMFATTVDPVAANNKLDQWLIDGTLTVTVDAQNPNPPTVAVRTDPNNAPAANQVWREFIKAAQGITLNGTVPGATGTFTVVPEAPANNTVYAWDLQT